VYLPPDPSVGRTNAENVYLLCLSEGNADGLGEKMREELNKATKRKIR